MKKRIILTSLLSLLTLSSCSLNFGLNSSSNSNISSKYYSSNQDLSSDILSNIESNSSISSNSYYTSSSENNLDHYINMTSSEFYSNYSPSTSYLDSYYRSRHGFMSGSIDLNFNSTTSNFSNQPKEDSKYVKYYTSSFEDNGNTYVVYDYNLNIVNKIYKGGGYVSINEVASYIQAFGDVPGNYFSSKSVVSSSIWGKYSRYNHSYFSNDTNKYPNEPSLPGSSSLYDYYEVDIGGKSYNTNNTEKTRGTLRIVYSRYNYGLSSLVSFENRKVFYTYDHYSNFQEYLNYQNGFGERFGYNSSTKEISSYPEVIIKTI